MQICPSCGEELPDKFRLCGFCGAQLQAPPAEREVRKTVTVVFCDLAGSTTLAERLDSESVRAVMDRYFAAMRTAIEAHGGQVEKFIGDAVMAVFGLPVLHEDDALRAVRAALDMRRALEALNGDLEARYGVRLANRTGVNTGEVITGDGSARERMVTGDAVNVAARLEQAAPADGVLLGAATHRLVATAVEAERLAPLELKGKTAAVGAFRLVALRDVVAPADGVLVGREAELGALLDALDGARRDHAASLCVVVAPAGSGKSRLVGELAAREAGRAVVLRGRCLAYGHGITFWPLRELVHDACGITESDPPADAERKLRDLTRGDDAVHARVAAAIGLAGDAFPVEELFWGARKLLEGLAATRPVVAVVEDLHWAEQTFVELLRHVVASATAPILLVATSRPELPETETPLGTGPGERIVPLGLLGDAEIGAFLDVLAGGPLPASARDAVVAAAAGNPLYAEQMLSMLIDEGRLRRTEDGWERARDLGAIAAPPTIQALLDARLDQLPDDELAVLEAASVIGELFELDALRALVPPDPSPQLPRLEARGLVSHGGGSDGVFRFEHALIRDSAYARVLKRVRADLHERFVAWAQDAYAARGRGDDLDEILGYHLEQAHRYLAELGPLDERGTRLGAAAAARLLAAGDRAFAREDMPAAAGLLGRAAELLDAEPAVAAPTWLRRAEALLDTGDFADAEAAIDRAEALRDQRDAGAGAAAGLLRLQVQASAGGPGEWSERVAAAAEAAIPVLEQAGDRRGQASAWRALAWAHGTAGRFGQVADAAERAIDLAAAAGDERQGRRAASQYAVAALYGPTPVASATARCEGILEQARGDRRTEGLVGCLLARLVAMGGDVARARDLYQGAQRLLEDAGRSVVASSTSLDSCGVEVLAGDLDAAERELRRDLTALEVMGETYLQSTVAGELARVLARQGRDDEARRISERAEALSAEDDIASQALWRLGRAQLLVHAGQPAEACALADEAVALLQSTDAVVTQADALDDLATVRLAAGRPEAAREAATEALALHTAKGNVVAASAVREQLAAITGDPQRM